MTARKIIIAGNWKMHNSLQETRELVVGLRERLNSVRDVEVVVGPTFVGLATAAELLKGSSIGVAAQNCHAEAKGAFTGEISVPQLLDAGCRYVILGHSERRQYFGETDAGVAQKLRVVLDAGLVPIMCMGETLEQREAGKTFDVVLGQIDGGLSKIQANELPSIVLAYEPIWAIGTGKTASDAQAEEVHARIRGHLTKSFGAALAEQVRIQYGGSVKPANARGLLAQANIDGALVGGASLKVEDFAAIVEAAIN